jgi:hypothetical protein
MRKKFNLENRFDLLTGEILECKSPESYHLQNFKDKRNMKKFFLNALENKTPEVIQKFILDVYKGYADLKELKYAPQMVETMTIKVLPHAGTVDKHYNGGYSKLIKDLQLNSFLKYDNLVFPANNIPNDITIIQDTRERKAIQTQHNTIIKKLDFGDYTIERENQMVSIERKSANDLWGSVASNDSFARFTREIERAKKQNKYIIVLVESSFSSFFYAQNWFLHRANPDFIAHRIRDLCRKFPATIQFVFCEGRKEAAKLIPYLLFFNEEILEIDLQFGYNSGLIKL